MRVKYSDIVIWDLQPSEWRQLWELKLRSLKQEPVAFEDPLEAAQRFANRPESEWQAILSGKMSGGRNGECMNVFAKSNSQDKLVGMVSAIIPAGQVAGNVVATVQHMYVDHLHRSEGIGRMLLGELLVRLKSKGAVDKAELWVVTSQLPAICMYRRFGFRETGKVKRGIKRADTTCDEQEMLLSLRT